MANDSATFFLLHLLGNLVAAIIVAISWRTATKLRHGQRTRRFWVSARILAALLLVLGLFADWAAVFGGGALLLFDGEHRAEFTAFYPFILILAFLNSWLLARVILDSTTRNANAQLTLETAEMTPPSSPMPRQRPYRTFANPIGASIGLGLLAGFLFCGIWGASSEETPFSGGPLAGVLLFYGSILQGFGIAYWLSAAAMRRSASEVVSVEPGTLGRMLSLLAICLTIAIVVSWLWLGVLMTIVGLMLLSSLWGGERRAAQLTAFWTLANSLRVPRNLTAELAQQAAVATGRTQKLLQTAVKVTAGTPPWMPTLCAEGLVPTGSHLEVCGNDGAGNLAEILEAAASRETVRFARQSDPAAPRVLLMYISLMTSTMAFILGFIGYSIVPKFRKIFEDFGVEMNPLSLFFMRLLSNDTFILLAVGSGLITLQVCLVGEFVVSFSGWQRLQDLILGPMSRRRRTPDLLQGLRWAVENETALDRALTTMAQAPLSGSLRRSLLQAANGIREGHDPWQLLQKHGWIRPPEVELLQSAQAAGNLPQVLQTLSESLISRHAYRLELWLALIHPLIVLCFASLVGLIAAAMLLPLVDLLKNLPID